MPFYRTLISNGNSYIIILSKSYPMVKKFLVDYKGEEEEPSDVEDLRRFIRKVGESEVSINDPTIQRRFEEWKDYIHNKLDVIPFPGPEHYGMAPQRDDLLFWYLDATLRTGNIAPFRARLSQAYDEDAELDKLVNEEYIIFLDQFRALLNRITRADLENYFANVDDEAFFDAFSAEFHKHLEWVYERIFRGVPLLVMDHEYELSDPDNREEFFEAAAEVRRDDWAHETVRQRQIGIGALGYTGYIVDGEHLVDAILRGLALRIVDSPRVIAVINNNLEVAWYTTAPIAPPRGVRLFPEDGNLHLDLGIASIGSFSDSHDWSWNIGDPAEGFVHQLAEEYAHAPHYHQVRQPNAEQVVAEQIARAERMRGNVLEIMGVFPAREEKQVLLNAYDMAIAFIPYIRRQIPLQPADDIPTRTIRDEFERILQFLEAEHLDSIFEWLQAELQDEDVREPGAEDPEQRHFHIENITTMLGFINTAGLVMVYNNIMQRIPHVRRQLPPGFVLDHRIRAEILRMLDFLTIRHLEDVYTWIQDEVEPEDDEPVEGLGALFG